MRTTEPNEYSKKINGVPTDHKAVGSPVSKDGNIQIDDIKEQNYLGNNVMVYETATGFGRVPTLDDNGKVAKNQIPDGIGSIPITIDGKKVVSMAFNEILPPPKIYGVDQVGRSNPLDLPRTDDAIGMGYTLEGNVYKSDFDNAYPWSAITEVIDTKGNVFVRIPKFYHKYTMNSNGTYHVQICDRKIDDTWLTCFINGNKEIPYMDIGKYEASAQLETLKSVPSVKPLVSKNLPTFRTYARANGTGYHIFDIWNYEVLKLLFLVEYATTNSQSILTGYSGKGWFDFYAGTTCGVTNDIIGATGFKGSLSDKNAIKYRGIENPWGNMCKFVDGINITRGSRYVCNDITKYLENKFDGEYVNVGENITSGSMVHTMTPCLNTFPQICVPTIVTGANSTTFYCDSYNGYDAYGSGAMSLYMGGFWYDNAGAGLWDWDSGRGVSEYEYYIGSRLCYKPISEV